MNILSNPLSSSNKNTNKKKRTLAQTVTDITSSFSSSNLTKPKIEIQHSAPSFNQLAFPISSVDIRNPVTWNVNDVCSYLNQTGCSFALKTIKEQVKETSSASLVLFIIIKEIDGPALLLLDDLPRVQNLLDFKLGPAVKFCHVIEQLRTQVIDTFHSSPSLKTSHLSATNIS